MPIKIDGIDTFDNDFNQTWAVVIVELLACTFSEF